MFCYRFSVFSILLLPVLQVAAAPLAGHKTALPSTWGDVLVKHKWNAVPDNWVSLGQPPNDTTIDLYIALKPNLENALVEALYEVSQPRHPKYGAHLSKEQIAELVAPHPDTLEIVKAWLEYNGVPPSTVSTALGGGWLAVTGVHVPQANQLLGASYELYHHAEANDTILRTVGYKLPAALHTHVRTIVPTTAFTSSHPLQQTLRSRPGGSATAKAGNATSEEPVNMLSRRDTFITPSVLHSMYKTSAYVPSTWGWNVLGVVGFETQYPSEIDLSMFVREYLSDALYLPFETKSINNREVRTAAGLDSSLGTQYPLALTYPTPVIYYQGIPRGIDVRGTFRGIGDRYLEWLHYMINQQPQNIPQTISMAYVGTPETSITRDYAWAVCGLFGQLGGMGVTVLVASGDDGVGRGQCVNFFGRVQFYAGFPASCPLVTSVGGTTGGTASDDPEVANERSGGGFSIYFDRDEYQATATNHFLDSPGNPPGYSGFYTPHGRGVPDIALQSFNYAVILGRRHYAIDSTSCATQTAAAIFSLLNDYLIRNGQRPLGFLNPWLYEPIVQTLGFNDITSGHNPGCSTQGFYAVDGWDAVTGLGSPDFRMLQYLLSIQRGLTPIPFPDEP